MYKYHKIQNIYQRDGKDLFEGKYCSECVEYLADNKWIFTEKLDGTNIGVVWDGYKVSLQGRKSNQIPFPDLQKYLQETFCTDEAEELFEQIFGEDVFVLFGEGIGEKIQKNPYNIKGYMFVLFDVYCPKTDTYLSREQVQNIADKLNILSVPVINCGSNTLQEGVNLVKKHPTSILSDGFMEGLVAVPKYNLRDRCGNRIIVKIKCRDFKEE